MPVRYTKPLDGGWGWAVVLAVFMIGACTLGVIRSFGVFFEEFTAQFNQSATATSWVISVCLGITFGGTLLGVMLSAMFTFRPVAMVGGVLAAAGCIATSFSTSITPLYFTVGVLVGLGSSLAMFPSLSLVGKYFDKRRAIANGIAFSGVGVGNVVFPLLFTYLIEEYGWRGSFLIAAGVMLNITAFAALLRPIQLATPAKSEPLPPQEAKAEATETQAYSNEAFSLDPSDPHQDQPVDIINRKKNDQEENVKDLPLPDETLGGPCSSCGTRLTVFKTLLTNPSLVCFIIAQMCFLGFGLFIPIVHIAPRASHHGIEQYEAAFLVSMISIGDLIGRLLSGFLPTNRRFRHLHWYILLVLATGVSSLLSPLAKTYPALAVYCFAVGFLVGAGFTTSMTLLADLVGPTRLSDGMGLMTLLMSITIIGAPPIAGKLFDVTKNYTLSFIVAGCGPVLGGLIAAILLCLGNEKSLRRSFGKESSPPYPVNEANEMSYL
ncbi:hypothetical protein Bbelb_044970 [Branchiostoma belcheri]|nr:hypothetical protein Bbelb_044970 [Branchiostoma belcheri]